MKLHQSIDRPQPHLTLLQEYQLRFGVFYRKKTPITGTLALAGSPNPHVIVAVQ